ncbi:hypothetical protein LWM68_23160 [Niabella sp. W65]|nr:hypothetical protein [Niabella sp. W65]MCH7365415.1 hypothetical protein [Niabella sp. W65]
MPDKVGFAGAYAGVSNDHLIVAGGSQFPEGTRPWSGGVKSWNDKIMAMDKKKKKLERNREASAGDGIWSFS